MADPESSAESIARDIATVARIEAVPALLRVLCETTGMGFAAVARVTEDSWTALAVKDEIGFGLVPGSALDIDSTLCKEVRLAREPVLIDHASTDPTYRLHHTPRIYAIESYASFPIVLGNGDYFGNLCAIDPRPARLSEPRIGVMFKLFAELVALQIDSDRRHEISRTALLDERAAGELREQFIAILGHDLRNPLAAVGACGHLLKRQSSDPAILNIAARIERSTRRMSALIDDVLDLARIRLGGGLGVQIGRVDDLGDALAAVVSELRDGHPGSVIDSRIEIAAPVQCDRGRVQQLASNLLANAISHGAPRQPVRLEARIAGDAFVLEVHNHGQPIAEENVGKIFGPFWRNTVSSDRQGVGLGLHICAQIVAAHHGHIDVRSSLDEGTTFTVRLPVDTGTFTAFTS